MKRAILSMAAIAVLASGSAQAVLLTMDELPNQPVDGLSLSGVTFSFTSGFTADYNALGPGSLTYVQDPSIEGNPAGTLGLDFATPTPNLSFGVALSVTGDLSPGFSVELFDAALASLGVFPVDTSSLILFSEGQFNYSGTPISRALIDFNEPSGEVRFAFDNLRFDAAAVPEPGSLLLVASAFAALGFMRRRSRAMQA